MKTTVEKEIVNVRIKQLRVMLGAKQAEFASMIGIERGRLAAIETNVNKPGFEVIEGIIGNVSNKNGKAINPKWLILGIGDPFEDVETPAVVSSQKSMETSEGWVDSLIKNLETQLEEYKNREKFSLDREKYLLEALSKH
jgi:DNA-binding XRE family transcriptional regulator